MDNCALPPDRKGYCLWNPPTTNYNEGRSNQCSVVRSNLIVVSHALHNVANTYTNVINAISTFVETTLPNNIIKNHTILNRYSIKHE